MKTRNAGISLGMVGVLGIAFLSGSAAGEPTESSTDTRQRLVLATAQRDKILARCALCSAR